jgi:hypothetical protein
MPTSENIKRWEKIQASVQPCHVLRSLIFFVHALAVVLLVQRRTIGWEGRHSSGSISQAMIEPMRPMVIAAYLRRFIEMQWILLRSPLVRWTTWSCHSTIHQKRDDGEKPSAPLGQESCYLSKSCSRLIRWAIGDSQPYIDGLENTFVINTSSFQMLVER